MDSPEHRGAALLNQPLVDRTGLPWPPNKGKEDTQWGIPALDPEDYHGIEMHIGGEY